MLTKLPSTSSSLQTQRPGRGFKTLRKAQVYRVLTEPSKSSPSLLQEVDSAIGFRTLGIWNPLRWRSAFSIFGLVRATGGLPFLCPKWMCNLEGTQNPRRRSSRFLFAFQLTPPVAQMGEVTQTTLRVRAQGALPAECPLPFHAPGRGIESASWSRLPSDSRRMQGPSARCTA